MEIDRETVIITLNQLFEGDPYFDDTLADSVLVSAYIKSGLFEDHYDTTDNPDIILVPVRVPT